MDRSGIIDRLDKATDKAASFAMQRCFPISNNSNSTWIGSTLIKKNPSGFYNIYTLEKVLLFKNIPVFDVATIISQRYTAGEFKVIEKILILEKTFSKHHNDMLHYLHCIKGAKRRHDYDTMAILEDKFQISEIRAKRIRDNILFFKKVK